MASAYPNLILQDAASATGNGLVIGFGEEMRYGNNVSAPNQDQFWKPFKVRVQLKDTATGTATATVIVEDSADNSTYTTLATLTLTMTSGGPLSVGNAKLFKTKKRYIRARISALSGGTAPTVNCYCILGGGGV